MTVQDPTLEKRTSMVRLETRLGELCKTAFTRIQIMNGKERTEFTKRLTAYVLKHELEGGPLTDQVLTHTCETLTGLLGGMDIPEVKSE